MKNIILTLLSVMLMSCASNDDDEVVDSEYTKFISDSSIDKDIVFMPMEIYTTSTPGQPPTLKLKIFSKEWLSCDNYELTTTEFINGDELIIRMDGISEPNVCLTAFGPATTYLDLPNTTNIITFLNGNTIDRYSVDINQEKISIALIVNNFTESLHENTFRFPKNSFAYICGTNTDNTYVYEEFLAIIEQNPNFINFEFNEEGRIPYPESSDGNWVNHPSKYFFYSSDEDFENLGSSLNDFSTNHITENSGVSIAIYSWNNIRHLSWMND